MPNWIRNQLIFETVEDLKTVISKLRGPNANSVDFNMVLPIPEYYRDIPYEPNTFRSLSMYTKYIKGEITTFIDTDDCNMEIGKRVYENKEKYGYATWYDWCISNWGTKSNAAWFEKGNQISLEKLMLEFDTAWNPVPEIVKLISLMIDNKLIYQYCNDWDLSTVVEKYTLLNGEVIYDGIEEDN